MVQVSYMYLSSKTRLNLIILKTIYGYDHKYLSRFFFFKGSRKNDLYSYILSYTIFF